MPVIPYEQAIRGNTGKPSQIEPDDYTGTLSFGEAMDIAVRQSKIGSIAQWAADAGMSFLDPNDDVVDPTYDPFDGLEGTPYAAYASSFIDARNPVDTQRIKKRIDDELYRREQFQDATLLQNVAAFGVDVAMDPTTIVPFGAGLRATKLAGKVVEGAVPTSAAAAAGAALGEGILQSTQETRTAEDSAFAIGGAATIGAGLGAFAPLFGAGLSKVGERATSRASALERALDTYSSGSVGAAQTGGVTSLAQESLKPAFGLEKVLTPTSPILRAAASPSMATRQTMQRLAEDALTRNKNMEGLASPVSTTRRIEMHRAGLAKGLVGLDDAFTEYRLGVPGKSTLRLGVEDMTGMTGGKFTRRQFAEEVGRAMIRNDEHDIPEVARAAKILRTQVFDPLRDQAIANGLLPPGVESRVAASYLTRLYDREKIAARRGAWVDRNGETQDGFETRIVNWLADRQKSLEGELEVAQSAIRAASARVEKVRQESAEAGAGLKSAEADHKAAKALEDAHAYRAELTALGDLDPAELRAIATEVTDKILGHAQHGLNYEIVPLERGPLKSLTLTIPTRQIEDFLDLNVDRVARVYNRTMSTDVELAEMFGRPDMEPALAAVRDDYARLRADVTDPKELAQLDKQLRADLRDLSAVRDRIRGTYALPANPYGVGSRIVRTTKTINFLRALGGMAISSIPDAMRPVFMHGPLAVIRDGLVPLMTNLKGYKLAAGEAKLAGAALEMTLDGRALQIGDLVDDFAPRTKFENGVEFVAGKFGLMTLMDPWTAFWKQFTGIVSQSRTLDAVSAWHVGKGKPREIERLARMGIDEGMASRIARQFEAHGENQGTLKWANTEAWDDAEAAFHYRAALAKEIDVAIVTPGQEKPLWMSSQLGSVVGQFQSFTISSMQRVLLAGLQQRDASALSGFIGMSMAGMATYWVQANMLALGKSEKSASDYLSDNPAQWVYEGVDRGGALGYAFTLDHALDIASAGEFSGRAALGGDELSRYRIRNGVTSLLGPTVTGFQDVMTVTGAAAKGEMNSEDARAIRRLIPLNNVFWWRWMFNQAEDHLAGSAQ